jgi:hypothetical protein
MVKLSLSELADLTGKSFRTVKRRITDAGVQPVERTPKSALYASADALQAIYAPEAMKVGELDLGAERARLAKMQADRIERDLMIDAGELVRLDEVTDWYGEHVTNCRARLLQLPGAVAVVFDREIATRIEQECRSRLHEALAELSTTGDPPAKTSKER